MDFTATDPALLVVPINYEVGFKAALDGEEIPVWRVNSALTGVLVNEGKHRVDFKVTGDSYPFIFVSQLFLYGAAAVLMLRRKRSGG